MNKIKVAIYIRVSTLDQAEEGYSLDAQERTLRKWAADKKYEVYDLYADRGISGKNIDRRPEMRRLLEDAKEQRFDLVLFWALSRFTRSVSDLYRIMEKFTRWNISLASYTEAFDTSTPMGRAMIGVVGVFAQLERELTSERVSAAIQERALKGKPTCHEVLGYDYDKKTHNLYINEMEAEQVRFIFESYLIYKNLSQVAEICREKGYTGKRGRMPSAYTMYRILVNAIYCGYNNYHNETYPGTHEPIITIDTYNKVQTLLKRQGKIVGRKRLSEIKTVKPLTTSDVRAKM